MSRPSLYRDPGTEDRRDAQQRPIAAMVPVGRIPFGTAMRQAMTEFRAAVEAGVSREDAAKGLEVWLRDHWPTKREAPPAECAVCDDTGYDVRTCSAAQPCGAESWHCSSYEPCGVRSARPCLCRPTNRTYQRAREAQRAKSEEAAVQAAARRR